MLVNLNELLTLVLFVLLIILVIIFIALGIKLIRTLKKVDNVIDDVEVKIKKVNGVFDIIDKTADYASTISDKIIGAVSSFINVLFKKKRGNDEDE